MKYVFFFLLAVCQLGQAAAQLVETTDFDTTMVGNTSSNVLDQASLGYAGTSPNLTLKTYKLSALIGKSQWDLYMYNSVSAYTIAAEDSSVALGNDILNQLGGLFNISLSKMGYFANGTDPGLRDIKGGQLDFRIGGKVLDAYNRNLNDGASLSSMVPLLQSTLDVRFLVPLVNPGDRKNTPNFDLRDKMLGNLSIRVYGTAMQVLRQDVFNRYYTDVFGNAPSTTVLTGNIEMNLFITNQFYISAGYSLSNQKGQLANRSFFSISYAGK